MAAISLAEVLGRLEGGLLGPLAGYVTDRFGPRTMLAFGGITSGLGFILLSLTRSYFFFLLVFVGLISLGFRSGYNNASVPALNQWFRRRRALAMSVASTGNGLGGVVLAPLVGLLVLNLGWRTSALISGIAILAIVVPLSLFVRRSPESVGLQPDGDRIESEPEREAAQRVESMALGQQRAGQTSPSTAGSRPFRDPDFTTREAMLTPSYWLLVLAVGLRNTVHSGMSFLLVPVMVWFLQGAGRTEEVSLAMAIPMVLAVSLGTVVFNPIVGWLGDSWSKQRLSAAAMVAGVLALVALLNHSGHLWQMGLFVVLLAFSESANPLAWAIMGDFFGRRSFATLRGWQHLPDQFMSAATPWWMGLIFDHTGSYYLALLPLATIYGLSAICYWTIPRPRPPDRVLSQ